MSGAVVCGIDEAGLGPLLGPLAIGYAALALPEAGADPWRLLAGLVGKTQGKRNKLVVADSKKVFARNEQGRRRLEATALAFLALLDPRGVPPREPRELLFGRALAPARAMVARHPWYARLPASLPLEHEAASIELLADLLKKRMAARGVRLLDAGVRVVPEGELNASYDETSNKALSVWQKTLEALSLCWRNHGAERPLIVIDRQGGRMRYGPLLAQGLQDAEVELVFERGDRSEYRLAERGGARAAHVVIVERAEDQAFPVALASCLAKYARELAMGAFNAYFVELQPGLRPTAGYRNDGWRWLREAQPALERAALPRQLLVRER
jgi:ribonuclease HII